MEIEGIIIKNGTMLDYINDIDITKYIILYPTPIWEKIKEQMIEQKLYDYANIIDLSALSIGIITGGELLKELKRMKNYEKLYNILINSGYIASNNPTNITFDDITWLSYK